MILIAFVLPVQLRIRTKLGSGSGTVDKMAGIFTKYIWQPYYQAATTEIAAPLKLLAGSALG